MKITCLKCNKEIGEIEIDSRDRVRYTKLSGILSARKRLDGNWGFQCICGNYSLLCEAEEGIIGPNKPSVSQVKNIYERLQELPTAIVERTKEFVKIDDFMIQGANEQI